MVFIFGIDHSVQTYNQRKTKTEIQNNLELFLEDFILKNTVDVCAEEMSTEGLDGKNSFFKDFSLKHGLIHKFCDPDSNERRTLGIPSRDDIKEKLGIKKRAIILGDENDKLINGEARKYWQMREVFWFNQIKDHLQKENILFLCGSDHIKSFSEYLKSKDIKIDIVKL